MVTPSCAVTFVVITFAPIANEILVEAVPDATAVPFTVTAAFASDRTGVTVTALVV